MCFNVMIQWQKLLQVTIIIFLFTVFKQAVTLRSCKCGFIKTFFTWTFPENYMCLSWINPMLWPVELNIVFYNKISITFYFNSPNITLMNIYAIFIWCLLDLKHYFQIVWSKSDMFSFCDFTRIDPDGYQEAVLLENDFQMVLSEMIHMLIIVFDSYWNVFNHHSL